jgi:hypothetical protein
MYLHEAATKFMKYRAGVFLFAAITLGLALGAPVPPRSQLRTNGYTWHAETSPRGPVLVVMEKMLTDLRSHIVVAPAFRDFAQSALQPGDTMSLVSFPVLPRTGAASPVE